MYKFLGFLSVIACAIAAPHPGFLGSHHYLQTEPIIAATPVATSYANVYQKIIKSPILTAAPLIATAPIATSYAHVYQKIEKTPVVSETPVTEATPEEVEMEIEENTEPASEVEPEPTAETEAESTDEPEPLPTSVPETEEDIETVTDAEPVVETKEVASPAPVATSYSNFYQRIEKTPVVTTTYITAPVLKTANYIATSPLVASVPALAYTAHPISVVPSVSVW